MASGQKKLVINTRERAVSSDINRLQAFADESITEAWRWLTLPTLGTDLASTIPSTTSSPVKAMILNGLWARPEIGTVNLFIEPGALIMSNPDVSPSADDSTAKLIVDNVGEQTGGVLTLTAGGGGTRIDVIECSRNPAVVQESSSRDIYNTTTGLFSASLVDKVVQDELTYRIRLGTPGGGFPGTVSGWLPLAIASVPNAAVTWNDVIVWDVRPLVADLCCGPAQVAQNFPRVRKGWATVSSVTAGTPVNGARGICEVEFNQWIAGGEFAPANSGLSGNALNWSGAEVLEPAFVSTTNSPWYLYACFPHSLPRWARYTPSSSGVRKPMPFRGIPVFTQKPPADARLQFSGSPINLPTVFGLANVTAAVPVATGVYSATNTFTDSVINGSWTTCTSEGDESLTKSPTSGNNTAAPRYSLIDGTTHPIGATAVRVRLETTFTFSNGAGTRFSSDIEVKLFDPNNDDAGVVFQKREYRDSISMGATTVWSTDVEIPLHTITNMPTGAGVTHLIEHDLVITPHTGTVSAYGTQTMKILGWRMGA